MTYRNGYADAIMGRQSCCPQGDWHAATEYLRGYTDGRATGTVFFGATEGKECGK